MKVLIVTNIPNPYRVPLFNELAMQCERKGFKLKIIFAAKKYERRFFELDQNDFKFDFDFSASGKMSFGNSEKTMFTYGGLSRIYKNESPDIIIVSGFSLAAIKAFWYTRFKKCYYVIWSGSVKSGGLRQLHRKILMAFSSGFVVYGKRAANYLEQSGVRRESIFTAINTVDTRFFAAKNILLKDKTQNTDNPKRLLFVGYLSPRKQIGLLLEAIQLLKMKRKDFILEIAGDGDDKSSLEKYVQEKGLNDCVKFIGFKQKEELPDCFAKTDVFLFQTGFDIWGLVLNEAMAAGIPCIVSPNAGASDDLIIEGENGFVIDYRNKEEVCDRISYLLDHPEEAKRIGENAAAFIEQHASLEKSAEGFIKAIEFAQKKK